MNIVDPLAVEEVGGWGYPPPPPPPPPHTHTHTHTFTVCHHLFIHEV